MTHDDALFRFRLRAFALARELGSVRGACRVLGIHPSTFYRWQRQLLLNGPDILRPRERRRPIMPNALSVLAESQIMAIALANPTWGPARLSSELRREKWGALTVSPNGVWRLLRRRGLSTRRLRLALIAGYAAPPERVPPSPPPVAHILTKRPGHRVQFDNFYLGHFAGSKGVTWQYTAVDVASSYMWADLHSTPKNPAARWTAALVDQVATSLREQGWRLEAVMTDNASEFRSADFEEALQRVGARHIFIRPGRPQSNGVVERAQQTVLHELWKPAFARYLTPKSTGFKRDLERYLEYYNRERSHNGRLTRGRTPGRRS